MKKAYSKSELIELGVAVADRHQVNILFATEDGQFFLNNSLANLHASNGGSKVHKIEYTEVLKRVINIIQDKKVSSEQLPNPEIPIVPEMVEEKASPDKVPNPVEIPEMVEEKASSEQVPNPVEIPEMVKEKVPSDKVPNPVEIPIVSKSKK